MLSKNRKPLIYLAGPYKSPCPVSNTRAAVLFGRYIESAYGVLVFVPHVSLLEHLVEPHGEDFWLRRDLEFLQHCDALYRMEGTAAGADGEVAAARGWNIPVFHQIGELQRWLGQGCPAAG